MELSRVNPIDVAGREAAILSAVEIGLGSIIWGLHIPLAGNFLPLNQIFILTRSVLKTRPDPASNRLPLVISSIAAVLKSLSPAGGKLQPMLGISMQGLLMSLSTMTLGPNLIGLLVGGILADIWSFIQVPLVYYVMYGDTMLRAWAFYYEKTRKIFDFGRDAWVKAFVVMLALKIVLGSAAVIAAYFVSDRAVERYQNKMVRIGRSRRQRLSGSPKSQGLRHSAGLALRDLMNPLFLCSLVLTGLFFYFAESSASRLIWALMRPAAVGFVLFFFVRAFPVERAFRFSKSFQAAVKTLKEL